MPALFPGIQKQWKLQHFRQLQCPVRPVHFLYPAELFMMPDILPQSYLYNIHYFRSALHCRDIKFMLIAYSNAGIISAEPFKCRKNCRQAIIYYMLLPQCTALPYAYCRSALHFRHIFLCLLPTLCPQSFFHCRQALWADLHFFGPAAHNFQPFIFLYSRGYYSRGYCGCYFQCWPAAEFLWACGALFPAFYIFIFPRLHIAALISIVARLQFFVGLRRTKFPAALFLMPTLCPENFPIPVRQPVKAALCAAACPWAGSVLIRYVGGFTGLAGPLNSYDMATL